MQGQVHPTSVRPPFMKSVSCNIRIRSVILNNELKGRLVCHLLYFRMCPIVIIMFL